VQRPFGTSWIALAGLGLMALACGPNRPLRAGDAGVPRAIDGPTVDLPPAPQRCDHPGDPCCLQATGARTCSDGLVCEPKLDACVACGDKGQYCCAGGGCNLGLACDRAPSETFGLCTSNCGLRDMACCAGGGCENGTACDSADPGGTCKACGLPGLKCCRGDCWIGVCSLDDPRMCVPCGLKGQSCCNGGGGEPAGCSDGSRCDKVPSDPRGTCI
jgi:hypothetical protein